MAQSRRSFEELFSTEEERSLLRSLASSGPTPNASARIAECIAQADEYQQAFIDCTAATIRLLAPAGSGKSQSIINRIFAQSQKGCTLERFLLLTFDNAAVSNLRAKLNEIAPAEHNAGRPLIATLNSFGNRLLRGPLKDATGNPSLGENPSHDQREAVKWALREFQNRNPDSDAKEILPFRLGYKVYLDFISLLKNNLYLPDELFGDKNKRTAFLEFLTRSRAADPWIEPPGTSDPISTINRNRRVIAALLDIFELYQQRLQEYRRIDFDDQKLLPYLEFRDNDRLLAACMRDYDHVIIDEFQDINRLDFELIALVSRNKSLVVVGDDDQAIYAFRGCSPRFISNFWELSGREGEHFALSVNYRCPKNIVEMSSKLISHNKERLEKKQIAKREDDADIRLWSTQNPAAEAQVIARQIRQLISSPGNRVNRFSDIAILFRMNSQSLPLQLALILEEIPYHCRKEDNLIVSKALTDLVNLLRIRARCIADRQFRSEEGTKVIFECLAGKPLKEESIRKLHKLVENNGGYFGLRGCAPDVLTLVLGIDPSRLSAAIDLLYANGKLVNTVSKITQSFNLRGIVGNLQDAVEDHLPLGELVDLAGRFQGSDLEFCDLLEDLKRRAQDHLYHEQQGESVELMTYFRAKGRQWPTVFLPGVNQKVIPHAKANVEEERRLFYVAVTRPTHNLIISYVRQAIREKVDASQFLIEIGLGKAEEKRAAAI
ncbi:MAG TPA: ATP-dependent helicase [Bryobacteraceae bacterium]|nr:ATP-dependent helicase [Bryobacteraceae bacterium]